MIKTETVYKVSDTFLKYDNPIGFWISENKEVRNMGIEEALKHSKCIDNLLIDESIRDCIIFTFYDTVNHAVEKDEFVEIKYESLLEDCTPIQMIVVKNP